MDAKYKVFSIRAALNNLSASDSRTAILNTDDSNNFI